MPCSITDGEQYDDWLDRELTPAEEDDAYEALQEEWIEAKIAPTEISREPNTC